MDLFHLLIIDGLISRFGIGRQLLVLFLLILNDFREDQFIQLITDMVVLTWNGLRRQTHRYP